MSKDFYYLIIIICLMGMVTKLSIDNDVLKVKYEYKEHRLKFCNLMLDIERKILDNKVKLEKFKNEK